MNRSEVVQLILDTSDCVSFGEAPQVDFADRTPSELDEIRSRLQPIAAAVRYLQARTLEAMQPHLGEKGFARFGEHVYRAAPDTTIKVRRDVEGEFFDLVVGAGLVRRMFNPNDHRITALRELAEGWVDPETGEVGWSAFAERYLDVTTGDVKVTELPRIKAPKYIAESEDGTVTKR